MLIGIVIIGAVIIFALTLMSEIVLTSRVSRHNRLLERHWDLCRELHGASSEKKERLERELRALEDEIERLRKKC